MTTPKSADPTTSLVPITSPANPRVKALVRLRERRGRDEAGRTLVDGLREIRRALDSGTPLEVAYAGPTASRGDGPSVRRALESAGVPVIEVSSAVEARLSFGDRAEGIVAVLETPSSGLERLRLGPDPLVVVLEGVEKPGNLGAVLRSADGAGAAALIAADPLADLWSPNAIRASLGTIFGVPTAAAPSAEVISWCRTRSLRIVAARVDGERSYASADLTGPLAIVLGSEAEGLSDTWRAPDIEGVRLPMHGVADSLNIAAAAAVLLYEARRQRELGGWVDGRTNQDDGMTGGRERRAMPVKEG